MIRLLARSHFSPARITGTLSGVTFSIVSALICTGVENPHAPRHSTSMTVYLPSAEVMPSSSAPGVLEECVDDFVRTVAKTRRSRAHLDEVFSHRVLVIHRIEAHNSRYIRGRQIQHLGDFGHRLFAHPAAIFLHHPKRWQEPCHLAGISREKLGKFFLPLAGEDRCVRFVVRVHRSISPMTMSIDALIAMTSDRRCPSTIFGIAERFTKLGGRIRQRAGFDVPSETK